MNDKKDTLTKYARNKEKKVFEEQGETSLGGISYTFNTQNLQAFTEFTDI